MSSIPVQKDCFVVIGCGSIGRRHIGNLLSLKACKVIAVDTDRGRREEVGTQFGVPVMECLEEVWELRPAGVLITTPTNIHIQIARQAAEHGTHFFVEKPLSDSMEGIEQLLRVVRERSLVTLVGCNMRFQPGLVRIKSLVEQGAVGRVVSARVEVGQYLPDWHPGEDYRSSYSALRRLGGGVILDAIHEIDYLRWIMGEIETLACFAGKISHLDIETEDTAAILVRFRNGAIGELHLDYVQRAYSRSCTIIGDEGTIHWEYSSGEVRWFSASSKRWEVWRNPKKWQPSDMYVDEMRHWLRCLEGDEKPALDVFEAVRVLEIALAAKAASEAQIVLQV